MFRRIGPKVDPISEAGKTKATEVQELDAGQIIGHGQKSYLDPCVAGQESSRMLGGFQGCAICKSSLEHDPCTTHAPELALQKK